MAKLFYVSNDVKNVVKVINNVVNVFNNVMYKKKHDIWGCFSYKNIENPREILSLICTEMA